MVIERHVIVDGEDCTVVLSDQQEILYAAHAAGKAVIGIINPELEAQSMSPAFYIVDSADNIGQDFLDRVVRRHKRLPWVICETKRLVVREFCVEDAGQVLPEPSDSESDSIFMDREKLSAYIGNQYLFHEYGIWAVVEKKSGSLAGKAGITDTHLFGGVCRELGYHIFSPYRRQGYGLEACQGILSYAAKQTYGHIYARIDSTNQASVRLAKRLGFCPVIPECNEAGQPRFLYEWNYS